MKRIAKGRSFGFIFWGLVLIYFCSGCAAPSATTKGEKFPLMYQETPLTILVLPPINQSTAADAKEYYATTVQEVISYWGYYVFPYEITADILKMEGIYDAELLLNMPLAKFREYFGADAVLFTTIKKWNLQYVVLASTLTVSIDAELKSTKTDQTLWKYGGTTVVDLSGGQSGGGLAGLIAKAIVTAATTATADYVPYARQTNYRALSTLPYGAYHPNFMTDQSMQFHDQSPQASGK
jgi:hypothetical protein